MSVADLMALKCTMILGDCLEVMPALPESSVQMCFADLPYGCTNNHWDSSVNLERFWSNLRPVCSPKHTVALSANFRFAARLLSSSSSSFRYELIWRKSNITGFFHAKTAPLRNHEMILIFSSGQATYNAQMVKANRLAGGAIRSAFSHSKNWGDKDQKQKPWKETGLRYPRTCFDVASEKRQLSTHPTQKPVALLNWLVRTYSNPGDTVLDPVSGSGTTAVASLRCGRNVVCVEKDEAYFEASVERVKKEVADGRIDAILEIRR